MIWKLLSLESVRRYHQIDLSDRFTSAVIEPKFAWRPGEESQGCLEKMACLIIDGIAIRRANRRHSRYLQGCVVSVNSIGTIYISDNSLLVE